VRARREAQEHTTEADEEWVEALIARAQDALRVPCQPCFVMVDFQENNVMVGRDTRDIWDTPHASAAGAWRVSGVFDLHGTFFGDGEKALARQTAGYLSNVERARAFLAA
jgi:hypothetical protein